MSLTKRTNIESTRAETIFNYVDGVSSALIYLKKNLDTDGISECIDVMSCCQGKIVTTGMGKAGIAMRKFSSTLCSLGIPSCYLHPGEASHGDLGVLSNNDILFVASTSGKTREVLETIELAKRLGISCVIGITSHIDSPVKQKADFVVDMGEVTEIGQLSLAPTTSIILMLTLTDIIALILSEEKRFSTKDYSLRHHSGYLGKLARSRDR